MVDFYQQGACKANSWLFKMCCNSIVSVNNMSRHVQHAAYTHRGRCIHSPRYNAYHDRLVQLFTTAQQNITHVIFVPVGTLSIHFVPREVTKKILQ